MDDVDFEDMDIAFGLACKKCQLKLWNARPEILVTICIKCFDVVRKQMLDSGVEIKLEN